ncbi:MULTISPECIES: cysteine desulfurase family protein [Bacillus]|uniref:cysteine desulfurase family protein n=1 Tax=Bacillus TaxID=1386 RepID=UPI000BB95D81|nr:MULTISPECIES: cysteine desulfurase family protein [Bacillus]
MIYLDNSATTKPYDEVLETYIKVSKDYFANPSSIHSLGGKVEKLLQQSRKMIANLIGVHDSEIIFTSGGTEGNNLAIKGTALAKKNVGNHIITTTIEHPSVSEVFNQLEQVGFRVSYLDVSSDGRINLTQLSELLTDSTILLSLMYVNNEVGIVQPLEEVSKILCKYPNVTFHVDNVQGISKVSLPLKECKIDLCTMSAHKFHGLKGNGILYRRKGIKLAPLLVGGEQEWMVRSGTENVAGIVAMTKALRMSLEQNLHSLHQLSTQAKLELQKVDGVVINTPVEHSAPHIVNFSVPGIKSEVLVHALGKKDIYVSTTSACSSKRKAPSKTLKAMNVSDEVANSSIRISFSFETTKNEMNIFIRELDKSIKQIKEVTR